MYVNEYFKYTHREACNLVDICHVHAHTLKLEYKHRNTFCSHVVYIYPRTSNDISLSFIAGSAVTGIRLIIKTK
jgi:hypothetical protein